MNIKKLSALLVLIASPSALLASPGTDRKIEDAAKSSYNYRAVLQDEVSVSVSDGIVTLTGAVRDEGEKALAVDTVENLPGVVGVADEIAVKPIYPEHSDAWIAFKIRSRLLVEANVSATATTVSVKDGVVTLGGTATSVAQKELTAAYARDIAWVKSINNDMVVTGIQPAGETVGEQIDDASITSQVKLALLDHQSTSAFNTKVTTTDGLTVITGEASSGAEKDLVTKLAQGIRGVKSVTNKMTVKS